jgi:hypothetical protein
MPTIRATISSAIAPAGTSTRRCVHTACPVPRFHSGIEVWLRLLLEPSEGQAEERFAAQAYTIECDEVPVSSTEVLESNVVSIRDELRELKTDYKEHKTEFRAAITRVESEIKAAVAELRTEIRTMPAKAESDLKEFAGRVDQQFAEMRQDIREIRQEISAVRTDRGGKAVGWF